MIKKSPFKNIHATQNTLVINIHYYHLLNSHLSSYFTFYIQRILFFDFWQWSSIFIKLLNLLFESLNIDDYITVCNDNRN